MVLAGVFGMLAHLLYYVLWTYLYPQTYESFWLRAVSALVCVPLIFEPWLVRRPLLRRVLPYYWVTLVLYQLPVYFVFMSLMNGFSTVWAVSTMAACMFLVPLMFDWLLVLLLAVAGSIIATVGFALFGPGLDTVGAEAVTFLLVYVFALTGGSAFNHKAELAANERLAGMTSAVGTMAHELRTPLLGIRAGAGGLQNYLPSLLEGYELAKREGLPVKPMRISHYRQMQTVLDRIVSETEYSSVILDMLVANSSRSRIDSQSFEVQHIRHCIDTALERYPFTGAAQRSIISRDSTTDFRFIGSEILMVHVLFNLLKNALHFVEYVDGGRIRISAGPTRDGMNRLRFLDTGPGVAPEDLGRVFDRFYSRMPGGQGTGIGLAFARLVMRSFGGDILCRSELGRYCEFVMLFPRVEDNER